MNNASAKDEVSILIVEDSQTQAEQLRYLLEKHGYIVTCATNGMQALKTVLTQRPTLVISDIVMPEMDGYQLCAAIRGNLATADLPVVLLTHLSSPKDILFAMQCGADNFISKPYNEEYLVTRMGQILDRLRLREETLRDEDPDVVYYDNSRYVVSIDRQRMIDLLISTYEANVLKNRELLKAQNNLKSLNFQLEVTLEEKDSALEETRAAQRKTEETLAELRQKDQQLSNWHEELQLLNRLGSVINHAASLEELLGQVSETLTRSGKFGIEGGVRFCILGDDGLKQCSSGLPSDSSPILGVNHADRLCGLTFARGEILIGGLEPIGEDNVGCVTGNRPGGKLLVPLRAKDKTVGVLCLHTAPGYEPEARQKEMLDSLGKQLGMAMENLRLYEETRRLSLHDPLTGLANRRMMDIFMESNLARASRFNKPFSLMLIDIDYFKRYNDNFGHDAGDRILALTASVLRRITRKTDLAARFGGEEFVMILSDADQETAVMVAEKLRTAIQEEVGVTVSIGVAEYTLGMARDSFIKRADEALYRAKQNGRNKVEQAPATHTQPHVC